MPIIVVTGKEIEKIKGDFESYLSGLNMVGEISYSQYSELYDEGTKQIQRAYELGKSELEKENAELKESNKMLEQGYVWHDYDAGEDCYEDTHEGKWVKRDEVYQLTKAKEIIKKFLLWENDWHNKTESKYELLKQAEQFLRDCDIDNAIHQANKGLDFDKIADEMEQDLKDSEVEK